MEEIRLTQFSHGAGCGCKIAPGVLEKILQTDAKKSDFPALLVGNDSRDDAAVYDIGNGNCIVSTTDFFMPIVDDPFAFGEIASANALSDVYAMGGNPIMAIAILGWPVGKISEEIAQNVLDGSRSICAKAGIPLAGGHSIDSPEPFFGLAATGLVEKESLKQNNTAPQGCLLYLTKPIGVGMVTTAHKRAVAMEDDFREAVEIMKTLNLVGFEFGKLDYVAAMTDVTGFGLLGHLLEVCDGSNVSAEIEYDKVPKLKNISHYASHMIYPDNTFRNWNSYQSRVDGIGSESLLTLCDPQTSGGLLVCIEEKMASEFEKVAEGHDLKLEPFGKIISRKEKSIFIK